MSLEGGGRECFFFFHLFTQKNNLNVIQGPVQKKLFPIFWQKLHGKFVDVGLFFIFIFAPIDHVYSKKTPFSVCLNMAYGSLSSTGRTRRGEFLSRVRLNFIFLYFIPFLTSFTHHFCESNLLFFDIVGSKKVSSTHHAPRGTV